VKEREPLRVPFNRPAAGGRSVADRVGRWLGAFSVGRLLQR